MRDLIAQHPHLLPQIVLVGFFSFGALITLYVLTDRRRSHLRRMESLPLEDGGERREQRHG